MVLFNIEIAKELIRLRRCAGWYAPLSFVNPKRLRPRYGTMQWVSDKGRFEYLVQIPNIVYLLLYLRVEVHRTVLNSTRIWHGYRIGTHKHMITQTQKLTQMYNVKTRKFEFRFFKIRLFEKDLGNTGLREWCLFMG